MVYDCQLWVDCAVECPKSQDFSKIMEDLWAQGYELAWENREELHKYLAHETKESTPLTAEIGAAETTVTELRLMV